MLKWKRNEFRVTGTLMTRSMFETWVDEEGRATLRDLVRRLPNRWFFGESRARRRLHKEAKGTFARSGTFAGLLKKQLDQLPLLVRGCAIVIRRSGYQPLNTIDGNRGLCVVPRGVLQKGFKVQLMRDLVGLPQVRSFRGLTERVLTAAAVEAESVLFDYLAKGNTLVDTTGRGLIIDVDRGFRWRLEGIDGHYYYAYMTEERIDLAVKKEYKRFVASMQESLKGQAVYLKRLSGPEVMEISGALQMRRIVDASAEFPGARVRSRANAGSDRQLVSDFV